LLSSQCCATTNKHSSPLETRIITAHVAPWFFVANTHVTTTKAAQVRSYPKICVDGHPAANTHDTKLNTTLSIRMPRTTFNRNGSRTHAQRKQPMRSIKMRRNCHYPAASVRMGCWYLMCAGERVTQNNIDRAQIDLDKCVALGQCQTCGCN
jgi:hypothetical protein